MDSENVTRSPRPAPALLEAADVERLAAQVSYFPEGFGELVIGEAFGSMAGGEFGGDAVEVFGRLALGTDHGVGAITAQPHAHVGVAELAGIVDAEVDGVVTAAVQGQGEFGGVEARASVDHGAGKFRRLVVNQAPGAGPAGAVQSRVRLTLGQV